MTVRVRFAPSPTGFLHIGGARTAIFNWLYARKTGGTFILRIEDTDVERSTQEFVDEILQSMKWLGMDWDEGPYYQMQRMHIYRDHAEMLLKSGKAYKCYCTKDELEKMREEATKQGKKPMYNRRCRELSESEQPKDKPYVIRFKTPIEGVTTYHDLSKGEISYNNTELDDLVIMRSDGTPIYNFTVVVDDLTMGITHVIRGDDHINNTPRQVLIYRAFGKEPPQFMHVPMILGKDRTKLSKRHGAVAVTSYKKTGYLKEALFNYLVRLGWSHGDQEIFSVDELKGMFEISTVGKAAAVFDDEKLKWLNGHYIRTKPASEILGLLRGENLISDDEFRKLDNEKGLLLLKEVKERAVLLTDIPKGLRFYLEDMPAVDPQAQKNIKATLSDAMGDLIRSLSGTEAFTHDGIEKIFKETCDKYSLKLKELAQCSRVLLTGSTASPSLFLIMEIMGRDAVQKRLSRFEQLKN